MIDIGKDSNKELRDRIQFSVKDKYGFIPKSVLKMMQTKELKLYVDDSNYLDVLHMKGVYKLRGAGFIKKSKIRLSQFNTGLMEFLLKKYLFAGVNKDYDGKGRWILDPFMGRATRPLIANKYGFNYEGYDVSSTVCKINEKMIEDRKEHPFYNKYRDIVIHNTDGTLLEDTYMDKYDSVITCPPYWHIEKYHEGEGQLSLMKIDEFKDAYSRTFKNLKGKVENYIIFVVSEVRDGKNGIFDLPAFTVECANKNGFILWDKIYHENLSPTLHILARRNESVGFVHKVHETVLVFKNGKNKNE